jgi:hypothetical protein
VLSWSDDHSARLWNAGMGSQIGQQMKHDGAVLGARFSDDEASILTWSDDNTARVWELPSDAGLALTDDAATTDTTISASQRPVVTRGYIEEVCARHLQGSLARTSTGLDAPFPRLVDEKIAAAAPILRGREGEDVCNPPAVQWWDQPLQMIVRLAGLH